jgi:hypothetical protein
MVIALTDRPSRHIVLKSEAANAVIVNRKYPQEAQV